jgi:SAM-dependent methyltransferase
MTEDNAPLWADHSFLRDIQYVNDNNLAARQSIYAYQQPKLDLPALVIDSLRLAGPESVLDVGCGNGIYLADLARRDHRGPVLGVDMSPGMLSAARGRAGAAHLVAGDATGLPLRDAAADLTFAMHMLYHVAEPAVAVAELRRVTRAGGRVVVALNGDDHLTELRSHIYAELALAGFPASHLARERIRLDQGAELLAGCFGSVIRHDLVAQLLLPDPGPVGDYVRSMSLTARMRDQERLVEAVMARLDFGPDGLLKVTTHSGWLICA